MGNFSAQQELRKETREKDKSRKENFPKFFFLDLAKLSFAGMVIGGITPWISKAELDFNPYAFIIGLITTSIFATIGYRTFK